MDSLLPSNSTDLEKSLEILWRESIGAIDGDACTITNPHTCPAHLLPWLAWAVSVDEWRDGWSEQQRRNAIADSITNHRIKGTRAAVENVLRRFGASVVLREWWQHQPPKPFHTFTVDVVGGSGTGTSITDQAQIKKLVDSKKPLRSHYTINVGTELEDGLVFTSRCVPVTVYRGEF